ncbi:hypothetical protein Ddc_12768 [Ditylenchus destructor]|nr:hypothetical protein Ddc_12768 [Ditylenchus destructor]
MNTFCVALCFVIAISFNVALVVAEYHARCPTKHQGDHLERMPVSIDCNEEALIRITCESDALCLPLVDLNYNMMNPTRYGCCRPLLAGNVQKRKTHNNEGPQKRNKISTN